MKKIYWICLVCLPLAFCGCKKEKNAVPEPQTRLPDGAEVEALGYRAGILSIHYPGADTSKANYHGKFGDIDILLVPQDDSTLVFRIPLDSPVGYAKLTVEGSGGFERYIEVKRAPDVPVQQSLNEFTAGLGRLAETVQQEIGSDSISAVKALQQDLEALLSRASETEKEAIALFYTANKSLFDKIFNGISAQQNMQVGLPGTDRTMDIYATKRGLGPMAAANAVSNPNGLQQDLVIYQRLATDFSQYALLTQVEAHGSDMERLFGMMLAIVSWERAHQVRRHILQNYQPIIETLYFLSDPKELENKRIDKSSLSTTQSASLDSSFYNGVPGSVYLGALLRGIKNIDRTTSTGSLRGFFNASTKQNAHAKILNPTIISLKNDGMITATDTLRLVNIDRYTSYTKTLVNEAIWSNIVIEPKASAGFTINDVSFASGRLTMTLLFSTANRLDAIRFTQPFAIKNEFNNRNIQLNVTGYLRWPIPAIISVATADGTPAQLSVPHGRKELQLSASVYPESAFPAVTWSIVSGGHIATVDRQTGLVKVKADTAGSVMVRAQSVSHSRIYTDFEIVSSRFRLQYVGGGGQSFVGGMPYPMEYNLIDDYNGACFNDFFGAANQHHKLKVVASVPVAGIAAPVNLVHSSTAASPCGITGYLYVERRNVAPYTIKVKVDLLQNGVIIDTHYLSANITDWEEPSEPSPLNSVEITYGNACGNGGRSVYLAHKQQSGKSVAVTVLVNFTHEGKAMQQTKEYRIGPGQTTNIGCTIPGPTKQEFHYSISKASFL